MKNEYAAILYGVAVVIVFSFALIGMAQPDKSVDSSSNRIAREVEIVKGQVKTRYGPDGRPVNQSEYAKGKHTVVGSCTLVNGVDTISLNTSTQNGQQDVSFIDNSTYFGQAWIVGGNGGKTYEIRAIAGNKFVIASSDTTDTSTVNFQVEGE